MPTITHLDELTNLIRRHEILLKDLRAYKSARERGEKDKGVLGSRGLTEFIVDTLKACVPGGFGYSIQSLLHLAEKAGYSVPTRRTMSKRLAERSYRVGDIAWSKHREWYWKNNL